jgi:hypothetical protein
MFNYPKILHLYWNNNVLSFLNYLTIISFNKFHKNWKIIVYTPETSNNIITWTTKEQQIKINNINYFDKLKNIDNVEIKILSNDFLKTHDIFDLNDVQRSDYLRFYFLHTFGGVWSDFDIIYIKNLEEVFCSNIESIAFKCKLDKTIYYPNSFLISKQNSSFFKYLNDNQLQNLNKKNYQNLGANLMNKLCPNVEKQFSVVFLDNTYHLFFQGCVRDIGNLFNKLSLDIPGNAIGIHWHNGSDISRTYVNNLSKESFKIKSTMDHLIKDYIDHI